METQKTELDILRPKDFRAFLQEELLKRCRKNPSYSLRSFAKQLGVGSSALTEMLSAKRTITPKSIEKFGLILDLTMNEISAFNKKKNNFEGQFSQTDYQQLTIDQFAIISDWYHYAILILTRIKNLSHSASSFGKALGITKSEANIAIERLLRIGLLEFDEETLRYRETTSGFATNISQNLTSIGSKKLQKQILLQSTEALMNQPIEVRNHTSMTMGIDPKLLPGAIERIKKFRRELSEYLETEGGPPSEVYQLSVSLFPVTQIEKKHLTKEN